MGISFRKRIGLGSAGRINISKSGIGGSVGNKAGRVGISSTGTPYARGGSNGVYYRSDATKSNDAISPGTPSQLRPSHQFSDLPVVSARMPIPELRAAYNKTVEIWTTEVDNVTLRITTRPVIEEYNRRYLSAVVNGRSRGTISESDPAWTALIRVYGEHQKFVNPSQVQSQQIQAVAKLAEIHGIETCRDAIESIADSASLLIQSSRKWCSEFDYHWNTLRQLGWLPKLG